MASLHIVNVGLVHVSPTGTILSKTTATIGEMLTASIERRVLLNPDVLNSSGYPTVDNYLIAEYASGFLLRHMDQYRVVTEQP